MVLGDTLPALALHHQNVLLLLLDRLYDPCTLTSLAATLIHL